MCLAIPGKVLSLKATEPLMADVDFDGIVREVCLECVQDACVGDYVIVHVGFAIAKLDEKAAVSRLQALTELNEYTEQQERAKEQKPTGNAQPGERS